MIIFTLSWSEILQDLAKLVFAFLLAVPIGLNREREERSAGVRTFPIVALASCGVAIVATRLPHAVHQQAMQRAYCENLFRLLTGCATVADRSLAPARGPSAGTGR